MTGKPSYVQRICLKVLAWGGYMEPGVVRQRAPRIYDHHGQLWCLGVRSTFDVMVRRGWLIERADGRYVLSESGLETARRFKP